MAIAVMGHLPWVTRAVASAAMLLSFLVMVGLQPMPSTPYVAAGQIPVICRALAFLLTLLREEVLWALRYALATLFLKQAHTPPHPPSGFQTKVLGYSCQLCLKSTVHH